LELLELELDRGIQVIFFFLQDEENEKKEKEKTLKTSQQKFFSLCS